MVPLIRSLLLTLAAGFLFAACGDDQQDPAGPSSTYRTFFQDLGKGDTDQALEELAPEGALGSTFQSAGYYMLAKEFDDHVGEHGELQDVIIDRERVISENEVMVEGRIRFEDGTEIPRDIRFTREQDRWVGRI